MRAGNDQLFCHTSKFSDYNPQTRLSEDFAYVRAGDRLRGSIRGTRKCNRQGVRIERA